MKRSTRAAMAACLLIALALPCLAQAAPAQAATQPITIEAGGHTFCATLTLNDTTAALLERLPLTLEMQELHGNEKYFYLPEPLPTSSGPVGSIQTGDIMLYGADCLVLFYQDFATPYRYTRLGAIDAPQGLAQALGAGAVTVTITLAEP